jgi:mannose/fructose/N-acetylgalactosamine-specific phosphotransferase system component IIB
MKIVETVRTKVNNFRNSVEQRRRFLVVVSTLQDILSIAKTGLSIVSRHTRR